MTYVRGLVKGVNWFGANSEFVISGSDCGFVYFWEKESQKIVHFLQGDEGGVVRAFWKITVLHG